MTDVLSHRAELLRGMLEEKLQIHTSLLAELEAPGRPPSMPDYDDRTLAALAKDSRRRIAEATAALERMADGTYGACQACGATIPLGRLRKVPTARFCGRCRRPRHR